MFYTHAPSFQIVEFKLVVIFSSITYYFVYELANNIADADVVPRAR